MEIFCLRLNRLTKVLVVRLSQMKITRYPVFTRALRASVSVINKANAFTFRYAGDSF